MTLQDQVAQLFVEARDDVYRYLLGLGLHPPKAQEAAQEAFLRLYATLKKGEEIENPRAWIFRVAHNLGLKIRAKQSTQAAFDADLEYRLAAPEMNPEQGLLDPFYLIIGCLKEFRGAFAVRRVHIYLERSTHRRP